MDKKELWVALSALTVAASGADSASGQERAGVAGTVNPSVKGQPQGDKTRVLFVGSDIFRNEVIRTDASGLAHLMFLDQSSLTVAPNSEVVIDRFVYDPDSDTGELTMSVTKGVLRFVGGALSKTGKVNIKTPVGNLGIRGAVALVESKGAEGDTTICLVYGEEVRATSTISGVFKQAREHEHCLTLTPDGVVEEDAVTKPRLEKLLSAFLGPELANPPVGREVTLPTNLAGWLRHLNEQDRLADMESEERYGTDAENRDIDDLAS